MYRYCGSKIAGTSRPHLFSSVPISKPKNLQAQRSRRMVVDQLAVLIESGEINPTTTVAEAIELLLG